MDLILYCLYDVSRCHNPPENVENQLNIVNAVDGNNSAQMQHFYIIHSLTLWSSMLNWYDLNKIGTTCSYYGNISNNNSNNHNSR